MPRWTPAQRLKNDAAYWAIRGLVGLGRRLPLGLASRLGAALGWLASRVAVRDAAVAARSVAAALGLGHRQARAVATASFVSLGRAALELCAGLARPAALLGRVVVPPRERARLDAALREGRGVVLVSAHLGSWELLGWALARAGYPLSAIAARSYDPRLTRLVRRLRRCAGVSTILRDAPGAALRTARVLRRGGLLGVLIDQSTRVPSVPVPFFGRDAPTPVGPAHLALRLGAEVVAGFLVRRPDGLWEARFRRIALSRRGPDDARDNTARMTRAIEDAVRSAPDQWVWMHRRWEPRAAG